MKVVITAGGTGGHIFPALALISKLKEKDKDVEILYIGTTDRMEKDIVPTYGIKYKGIEVSGFKRKLTLDFLKTMLYNNSCYTTCRCDGIGRRSGLKIHR